ncbi:MAG: hypothetical protein MUO50_11525, partial [Longimicrobiales bacterium]|nr:hypothetical protein [Longimicrobiales bacterium]
MKVWLRRLRRFASWLVLMTGVGLTLSLILLTQTVVGREWVLREVLARVARGIRGEIEVAGISSPGLLRGFTFRNITIRGEDGRTLLQADSVRAGISGPALLRGDLVFSGVHLWRPQVSLRRLSDLDQLNVVSIFITKPSSDSLATPADTLSVGAGEPAGGPKRTVLLRGAALHQGTIEILRPLAPDRRGSDRILVERGSDGGPALRRMTFRDIDL